MKDRMWSNPPKWPLTSLYLSDSRRPSAELKGAKNPHGTIQNDQTIPNNLYHFIHVHKLLV